MKTARFGELLSLLAANDVEFIVVGMAAGILHGAPVTTIDLDIVHRRAPSNVARLLQVLERIDAIYRHDPRNLRPKESHLTSPGHQLQHGEIGRYFQQVLDAYRAQGCGSCRYKALQAQALGRNSLLATVTWELLGEGGDGVISSWRESYTLVRVGGGLRVVGSVDHAGE